MKVTVIGGGSSYTPELADGIIKNHDTFPVSEIVLLDIEAGIQKAEVVCAFIKRMLARAGLQVKVSFTTDRLAALQGADFVISQFRAGGLKARSEDEKIPLRYGLIGQETTGPGGFANALRTIPEALEICCDIEKICPEAWLINFTNPSGIVTEAMCRYTNIKCIGLCNVPINMEREICKSLGMDNSRINCRFAGLNHLSFVGRLYIDGQEVLESKRIFSGAARDAAAKITGPDIPFEMIEAFGIIPSPYLRYFYLERDMLSEEMEKFKATGKTRADDVMETEELLFSIYRDESVDEKPEALSKRGGALYSEAAVSLMNSIWNDSGDIHVVNVRNNGAISGLPGDAVIETNCIVGKSGTTPLAYGQLPASIAGLVRQVKAYERLTIEAAVEGDIKKALVALANNPLVRDVKTSKAVLEDLVQANKKYLGQFFKEQ